MKKVNLIVLSICLAFTLISCGSTKVEDKKPDANEWISCVKEGAELNYGCFYTTDDLGEFNSIEVELKKDSGFDGGCFGLIFGYTDTNEEKLNNYTRFDINVLGEYALYSFDGSKYIDLMDPSANNTAYLTEEPSIVKDYGSSNKLRIQRTEKGTYNCYINNNQIASNVKVVDNTNFKVRVCFSVGKNGEDKLPDEPVQVFYRISTFVPEPDAK